MRRRIFVVVSALVLVGASVAYAAVTSIDTQANRPQVAGQPGSDTSAHFPTNKQNEPSIGVNPVDSRFLIAGSNDEQEQPECGPGAVRGSGAPGSDCSFYVD